jgi:dTDP-L-rhamnose 4-epimerase
VVEPLPTDEDKPLSPASVYAISKRVQEEMCLTVGQACGVPTVALRYFNVYGSRQALCNPYTGVATVFCSRLLHGQPPVVFEDGRQSRDFVHFSDVVEANLLAMECEEMNCGVFNVGTGRALTVLDVAESLMRHLSNGTVPEIAHKSRTGDIRHAFADINRIQAVGYQPQVRFEDGVTGLVEWVHSQTAGDSFEQARAGSMKGGLGA